MAGAPGCVSTSAVCDGLRQCSDGSDEFNCPENQGCLQGDWRCRNKICIPKDLYCNGANDCVDNSDEACGEILWKQREHVCDTMEFRNYSVTM